MKPQIAAALAPLLLAGALAAQRDTLRIPAAPGDSLLRPVPLVTDTAAVFDSPATAELVDRVRRAGSAVPAGLDDYLARMRSSIHLSVRADTSVAGELPVGIDEFTGDVRWTRGAMVQRVTGHRVRQLAPTPYTIGTLVAVPWVVPHLYGSTIDVFQLTSAPGRRGSVSSAAHPFSARGPEYYRYAAGDTVRLRTREGVTTLVPIEVRPRRDAPAGELRQVAGTFYIDLDRSAITRARFGFVERSGGLLVTETGVFFELDNGLVEGRYWLPVRQRRELQVSSPLFGGAVAVRMMTALSGYRLNTGWRAEPGLRLAREPARGDSVWEGYRDPANDAQDATLIGDFADLREAVRPPAPDASPLRVRLGYERSSHLFRYNRVEGAFLGAGLRVEPRDPARRSWDLYATAGYATAEGAARGEAHARWHPVPATRSAPQYTVGIGGYRRLRDTRAFRPPFEWELGYALSGALAGSDERDYFDATGGELYAARRRGPWTARLTGRHERQDSVQRNTESYLFGRADHFPLLAAVEPGDHSAVEAELRYVRGAGAFGLGSSTVASLTAELGFGDFETQRVIASVSMRRPGTYVTFAARADAGTIGGAAPPQQLFRFGGAEGLRGYDDREFAGSTAALLRGRLLLHLPPYGNRPLMRSGIFIVPPLRPAIVLSGDLGWSEISDESLPALERLFARTTDGERYSYGVGVSVFEDALSVEHVWPSTGEEGRWYVGLTRWF